MKLQASAGKPAAYSTFTDSEALGHRGATAPVDVVEHDRFAKRFRQLADRSVQALYSAAAVVVVLRCRQIVGNLPGRDRLAVAVYTASPGDLQEPGLGAAWVPQGVDFIECL